MITKSGMVAVGDRQNPVHRTEGASIAVDPEERHQQRARAGCFKQTVRQRTAIVSGAQRDLPKERVFVRERFL